MRCTLIAIEIDTSRKSIASGYFRACVYRCSFLKMSVELCIGHRTFRNIHTKAIHVFYKFDFMKFLNIYQRLKWNEQMTANGERKKEKNGHRAVNLSIRVHNFQYHFHTFATIAAACAHCPLDNMCWSNSNDSFSSSFFYAFVSLNMFTCFRCHFPSLWLPLLPLIWNAKRHRVIFYDIVSKLKRCTITVLRKNGSNWIVQLNVNGEYAVSKVYGEKWKSANQSETPTKWRCNDPNGKQTKKGIRTHTCDVRSNVN